VSRSVGTATAATIGVIIGEYAKDGTLFMEAFAVPNAFQ
jgi:hypothetical protein